MALQIYCRDICVNNSHYFLEKGPLLIAANHPNSFLDAIIVSTLFRNPVYSLTRGDVFSNKLSRRILHALKMLPVYRLTEGAENLDHNYSTFGKCREIFKKGGIVLIFSEGRCINEWHLRDLKKGTARLALSSWEEGIPLRILPLGINYQSFTSFGKNVQLHFGEIISREDISLTNGHGKMMLDFNELLNQKLKPLVKEVNKKDSALLHRTFLVKQPVGRKFLLAIPAFIGFLIHSFLYIPVKKIVWATARHSGHFDSIMVGTLFCLYPFFLLTIGILLFVLTGSAWSWLVLPLFPFCAWSYVQLKTQF